jgi:hypothetical protein
MAKIPHLDETQRAVLGALGVGLMLGGIAWASAVSITSTQPWPVRVLPPAVMFITGVVLLIWAWRGHNPRKAFLDKAIIDGRFLAALDPSYGQHQEWVRWREEIAVALREPFGLQASAEFAEAERSRDVADAIREQVTYLEGLRRRL